ncbi:hypothetical protein [Chromobacterium vaccinii]|uniref:hypothetical protein n=1 Tax=Chromobacterium vaccinii TaxID=1108595 RepID=UPI000ABC5EB6|nr:hypothetical protein [Chromobacterium vaccinii]
MINSPRLLLQSNMQYAQVSPASGVGVESMRGEGGVHSIVYSHREEELKALCKEMGDPHLFALKMYPGRNNSVVTGEMLHQFLSALDPNCTELLVDPAICASSRIHGFCEFVSKHGKFENCWDARKAYSDYLGVERVFRSVKVSKSEAENIKITYGLKPSCDRAHDGFNPAPSKYSIVDHANSHVRELNCTAPKVETGFVPNGVDARNSDSYSFEASKNIIDKAVGFLEAFPGDNSQRVRKELLASISKFEIKAPDSDSYNKLKPTERVVMCRSLYKSLNTALTQAVQKDLKNHDRFQSFTLDEDLGSCVADDPNLAASTGGDVYIFECDIPKIDLIDPKDYIDKKSFPDSYNIFNSKGELIKNVSIEHAEKLHYGSVSLHSITNFQPVVKPHTLVEVSPLS